MALGALLGLIVGWLVGSLVGADGLDEGERVGAEDGWPVGIDGCDVGRPLGMLVGLSIKHCSLPLSEVLPAGHCEQAVMPVVSLNVP